MDNPLSNPDTLNLNPDWPDQGQLDTSCEWFWTPEGNGGFWTAQCKEDEDWPISLLHEGAKFCAFCGNPLMVEGEA